mmetsp:Transcript_22717/g.32706  ORF Transcript_22717/g.32706 Transcript_22717/m.32706 type:complete len:85 (+) Transcript_22717:419-673(+)
MFLSQQMSRRGRFDARSNARLPCSPSTELESMSAIVHRHGGEFRLPTFLQLCKSNLGGKLTAHVLNPAASRSFLTEAPPSKASL